MQSLMLFLFLITLCGILGMVLACIPFKKIWTTLLLKFKAVQNIITLSKPKIQRPVLPLREIDLFKLNLNASTTEPIPAVSQPLNTKVPFTVLYLLAPSDQSYPGNMIWRIFLEKELVYGEMRIFHAYRNKLNIKNILFSVADATEPGYFDKHKLLESTISGLCFFMHHHTSPHALEDFEQMLKTAQEIQAVLGGVICDHQQKPLTEKTIRQYRQQLSSLFF